MTELASMAIESKEDVKFVCGQIGHLFKEGRKITVVILERGNDANERADRESGKST